jgi:ABC-2 type transport system permease protein
MKKYLLVISNCVEEYFAYRLNFILWRLRVVISVLITYFLWISVFAGQTTVFGYNESRILTYILMMVFVNGIVLSTRTSNVASEINYGTLSNFLIRPLNYFKFSFSRDLADKILNSLFSVIEFALLVVLFNPPIIVQSNIFMLILFLFSLLLAGLLYFEIGMILSFIGFWSYDTWAPRFIFLILLSFLSGSYFPLDILPGAIYNFLSYLPFTYLIFYPLKIYLGEMPTIFIYKGFFISFFWIAFLFFAMKLIWIRGLKIYTSEGQ